MTKATTTTNPAARIEALTADCEAFLAEVVSLRAMEHKASAYAYLVLTY